MRGKARKTGTGRGEKKIRKKSLEKVITGKSGRAGGGEKKRKTEKERALVPAVLKSFQTSTVIPGYAI